MIDTELANLSNQLMLGTVLLYVVAMLGYAADLAFGERRRREAEAQVRMAVPERTLVPTGAGVSAGGSDIGRDTAADHADVDHVGVEGVDDVLARPRTDWGRFAVLMNVLGWGCHLGEIITRGMAAGRVPWGNMYEFTSAIVFAAVTAYLLLMIRQNVRFIGAFLMVAAVIGLGVATKFLYNDPGPLRPILNSYWIAIHVAAAIIATGVFTVAAVLTGLYFLASRRRPGDAAAATVAVAETATAEPAGGVVGGATGRALQGAGRTGWDGLLSRLPSARQLELLSNRVIMFAFPIWTFAIIAGAIWADKAWGRYWGWDPKETWSFITWLVYAGYLHARATAGWKGNRSGIVSLVAYGCLLFNFFGINFLVSGLHSYA